MPKENQRLTGRHEYTAEEIAAQDEKFRTFFTTTVAQVPEEMTRRDSELDQQPKGLLARLFHRERPAAPDTDSCEDNTGELLLGCEPEEQEADLELVIQPEAQAEIKMPRQSAPIKKKDVAPAVRAVSVPKLDPEPVSMPEPDLEPVPTPEPDPEPAPMPEPDPELVPMPEPDPEPAPMPEPDPEPAPMPESDSVSRPRRYTDSSRGAVASPRPAAQRVTPQEEQTTQKLDELRALLEQMNGSAAAPVKEKQPETESARPTLVFAQEHQPEAQPTRTAFPEKKTEPSASAKPPLRLFGEQEPPRDKDDTMSLPLLELEEEPAAPAAAKVRQTPPPAEHEAPASSVWKEKLAGYAASKQAEPEFPDAQTPEEMGEKLRQMGASLTLRCVLSGLLALVLIQLSLTAGGLLPPVAGLDPIAAPAAFYGVNLLALAAAMGVAYTVLRDGLAGLRGTPSAETMPALAAVAALVQAAVALLNAKSYASSGMTLLSGVAALGLCLALVGGRVMLSAVEAGHRLASSGEDYQGAVRIKDKDLVRSLAQAMEEKDPWVLFSRPVEWSAGFVDQHFGTRASERRTRKTSYILLGTAVLSGLVFLLFGAGINGAAAAAASVLCMGAPLSSTLVAAVAALRLQRTAAAAGAVVPGWAATEELGGIDTVQLDADDLFGPDSVNLEDIRIFKGGRIDRDILYTASVLNQSCNTLRGLFRQIIEDRTDILFPVKDLETHRGLGFAAWCDNNRILLGNRAYLEQEGVPLPEPEYEAKHSQNGALQILYLAVSGNLHAMFVLRYVGGRNTARALAVLQRENIRLMVACQDPSLTARHIAEAYRLPQGMVMVLAQEQWDALASAPACTSADCCMMHRKGLASLTGGLAAAETAQSAETSATTVQLASVWLSVAIALLLTTAGSIGGLSVAAVLMYQAAWSALSIAVCAFKSGR